MRDRGGSGSGSCVCQHARLCQPRTHRCAALCCCCRRTMLYCTTTMVSAMPNRLPKLTTMAIHVAPWALKAEANGADASICWYGCMPARDAKCRLGRVVTTNLHTSCMCGAAATGSLRRSRPTATHLRLRAPSARTAPARHGTRHAARGISMQPVTPYSSRLNQAAPCSRRR